MAEPLVSQLAWPRPELDSYVQKGEALKASKREADAQDDASHSFCERG